MEKEVPGLYVSTSERLVMEVKHILLPFQVTKRDDPKGGHRLFGASIPDRQIVWEADTAELAIAHMLHGVAKLARDGALDPDQPERVGAPPIQHVLGILTERLAWHVERRREACENFSAHPPESSEEAAEAAVGQGRSNEAIAALGTAISALARIKDL